MKKLIASIAIAAATYVSAQAQGLVIFNNTTATKIGTNAAVGGSESGFTAAWTSQAFYYALFLSAGDTSVGGSANSVLPTPSGNGTYVFNASDAANWTQVALATNTTAGKLLSTTGNSSFYTTIAGLAAGNVGNFVLVGWSGNLGNSIAQLENSLTTTVGWLGESAVGQIEAGDGVSVPVNSVFGSASPSITPFVLGLTTVPEPGTLALAVLGGASMLLFRRKK